MIDKVLMPMLGETMDEATVGRWVVAEGDAIKKGDVLLEVTTDKATLEVESFNEGTIHKFLATEGMVVAVNEPIAVLADPDDDVPEDVLGYRPKSFAELQGGAPKPAATPAPSPAADRAAPAERPSGAQASAAPGPVASAAVTSMAAAPPPYQVPLAPMAGARLAASPRAKSVAAEKGLGWRFITGSGPNGRIRERDVLAYESAIAGIDATSAARRLAAERHVDLREVEGAGPRGRVTEADVAAADPSMPAGGFERRELSPMRRVVAERMTWSAVNIPQFALSVDVDMTAAGALRKKILAETEVKVTFTDIIVKAAGLALREHPAVASLFDAAGGGTIIRREGLHVGVAVSIDEGLMVPVVRNADKLVLTELSTRIRDLADRARSNKLTPDEYTGGVLTISNLGMLGIDEFKAIVNPGESAILASGTIKDTPVALDGEVVVRPVLKMTGTFDHRTVDGAAGARYLSRVKELLLEPEQLV
ncbi:MAG: dihydrolipoamide acetyltransferase family protein [Planctomycetota bacterium]|jgi:pyruvate dehydrogenase E2 component (dihydrolipoamide acetyltransferase)